MKMFVNGTKRKLSVNGDSGGQDQRKFKRPKFFQLQKTSSGSPATNLLEQRKKLPIFSAKKRFLEEASKHNSLILVGETGSGKTTQIPQFLHEAGLHKTNLDNCKRIGITQPRRVAAITLAQRVSQEMGTTKPGPESGLVGYKVRFEDATSHETELVFQTDGMLLREAMLDPMLASYSWIILDEAHERTVQTDVLFGVVKAAQFKRAEERLPSLKIIVMSATMDADKFSRYFRAAPILYVAGRQHPVNVRHVTEHQEDWQNALLTTIIKIHEESPEKEDILVFMTGQEEIEAMARNLKMVTCTENKSGKVVNFDENGGNHSETIKLNILPLYASQQPAIQQKVFLPTKPGCRKVILATNIAETSLTIPGVHHVIDSCRVKTRVHQASTGLDMLKVVRISKAQAFQRTGRAGRESEGHCYRMLTRHEFDSLPDASVPEIQRCNLSSVMLQLLSIGVKVPGKFNFLEPPPQDAIEGALRQLNLLGAVTVDENESSANLDFDANHAYSLSETGKRLATFPLDPKYTKAILAAQELGCTEEIITIVSILSGDNILITPVAKREEAISSRKAFVSSEGDHVTLLKVYRAFKQSKNQVEFCKAHFVHYRHLQFVQEIRKQLVDLCRKNSVEVKSCGQNFDSVRRALSRGLFTNVAKLTREGHYVTLDTRQKAQIHPSSTMFSSKPELVIFTELVSTQKSYIRDLTLVDPVWLANDQPKYFRKHRIVTVA